MFTPDLSTRRFLLPPMNREGNLFVLIGLVLTLILTLLWAPLCLLGIGLTYGVFLFFRDPDRSIPISPDLILSPADGLVSQIEEVPLPSELEEDGGEPVWRISIFMSVLNVHVNRMPATGTITKIAYVSGQFFNASLDKASSDNERMLYLMQTPQGAKIAFVQIAGLIARRIVSFVNEQQSLEKGTRFGLIRFGSRVDVYLPGGITPRVQVGQTMVAGETPLAHLTPLPSLEGSSHG